MALVELVMIYWRIACLLFQENRVSLVLFSVWVGERDKEKKLKNVSLECQKGKERYLSYIENCLFILILINKVGGVARNKQFSKIQSYLL